jgi:hypothetical protein
MIDKGSEYFPSKKRGSEYEYDIPEVQRPMDGFMNMSSSAEARVLYERWALRSTFLPIISPSMFTFTQPTTRPFFRGLSALDAKTNDKLIYY